MKVSHKFRKGLSAIATTMAVAVASPALAADPPEWTAPIKPFRIAGNIYYVGTKGLASYLILSRQGAILLDGTLATNERRSDRA